MTQRTKPPFRADHVGSILRTAPVKDARAKREKGEITAAQLKEVEDREIEKIIKKQEEIGLKVATDGEFRRSWWHFDFYGMLDNVEIYELDHGIQFQGVQTKPRSIRVTGKIGFSNHPMLEHFKFLKAHTKVMPKMCIPAPSTFHFRLEPNAVSKNTYASRDAIFDDLAVAYQKAIKAFYDAGCRYLQFDDTAWAYLCSQAELQKARDRGLDVDHLQESYTKCINKALQAKPADMAITTHVCRGNFRSTFISSGGYEPVAESLLSKCNYDGYFLEYDTDRAGGFEPLRFLPKGNKIVVLGLVTTKSGRLERTQHFTRRSDALMLEHEQILQGHHRALRTHDLGDVGEPTRAILKSCDLDNEVDAGCHLFSDRLHWQVHGHEHHVLHPCQRVTRTVRMHGCQ